MYVQYAYAPFRIPHALLRQHTLSKHAGLGARHNPLLLHNLTSFHANFQASYHAVHQPPFRHAESETVRCHRHELARHPGHTIIIVQQHTIQHTIIISVVVVVVVYHLLFLSFLLRSNSPITMPCSHNVHCPPGMHGAGLYAAIAMNRPAILELSINRIPNRNAVNLMSHIGGCYQGMDIVPKNKDSTLSVMAVWPRIEGALENCRIVRPRTRAAARMRRAQ